MNILERVGWRNDARARSRIATSQRFSDDRPPCRIPAGWKAAWRSTTRISCARIGVAGEDLTAAGWLLPRPPHLLETSLPGVFAVGDVRSGSVKRIAVCGSEGSICVQFVHRALREISVPVRQMAASPQRKRDNTPNGLLQWRLTFKFMPELPHAAGLVVT